MKTIRNPDRKNWADLCKRPSGSNDAVLRSVEHILKGVKEGGDKALRQFTEQFDGAVPGDLFVSPEEMEQGIATAGEDLKAAIRQASKNIERFHRQGLSSPEVIETAPGVQCWRRSVGIQKVGLYIPGGTAPLFSTVLMLGIPAKIAGCAEVILCTPANKGGAVHPAVLYAAQLTGITKVVKVGGAQAIAAMAYGTETVPAVYKIFGPGNQYVTAAKRRVQEEGIAIDMPAGPSEVCVLADEGADPRFIAADLLSQAEHGADSQVLLVSTSEALISNCLKEVALQVQALPRQHMAQKALANSRAVYLQHMDDAVDLVNEYAAEHLIINCREADAIAEKIINAGSVFIGAYSPESAGDYASGTNHTLPTNAFARAYSGVSVDSFVKKITVQKLSQAGLKGLAKTVITMAEGEGLQAHAEAVRIRLRE